MFFIKLRKVRKKSAETRIYLHEKGYAIMKKPHGRRLFFLFLRHLVVEVQTEHKSLVVGVRAANVCALDNAAFEDIGYTHYLAEF